MRIAVSLASACRTKMDETSQANVEDVEEMLTWTVRTMARWTLSIDPWARARDEACGHEEMEAASDDSSPLSRCRWR